MLSPRQNAYLRSLVTASMQKADTDRTSTFPDPRGKPATRPTVTVVKSRTPVPRYVVQTFRTGRSECDPFGDLQIAHRHAALNAPASIWLADQVTIEDGVVSYRIGSGVKPLATYA